MHEMPIAQNLIDILEQEMNRHAVKKLKAVHLAIGRMSTIVPQQLTLCFEILTEGTGMAGVALEIRMVPATYKCRLCGEVFTSEKFVFECVYCKGADPELLTGKELRIESIEVID